MHAACVDNWVTTPTEKCGKARTPGDHQHRREAHQAKGVRGEEVAQLARPVCHQAMESGGMVLSERENDGRRSCRPLWRCAYWHEESQKRPV